MKLRKIFPLLALLLPIHAHAQINDGSCSTMLQTAFATEGQLYTYGRWRVLGTSVHARDESGFHAFTMDGDYQVERGLVTSYAISNKFFTMEPVVGNYYTGTHVEVFPDRGNGDEDRTTLNIYRSGRVEVILNTWGDARVELSGVSCYSGHTGVQFILTGFHRSGSHGVVVYTFLIQPCRGTYGCSP